MHRLPSRLRAAAHVGDRHAKIATGEIATATPSRPRVWSPGPFSWLVRQRGTEDWIVAKLPRTRQIDAATIHADRAGPIEMADDPRPPNFRNIPPIGGGN